MAGGADVVRAEAAEILFLEERRIATNYGKYYFKLFSDIKNQF